MSARISSWLPERPSAELAQAIERLARAEDVVRIAVMPDAHVAEDVCVGAVTATTERILPAAVGGDLGCGMEAIRFHAGADVLADRTTAARVLAGLYRTVPQVVHASASAPPLPDELAEAPLSASSLEALKSRDARLELGTVGRGNHFVELQRDDEGALWLMAHSGSRAVGPAVRAHHESRARRDAQGFAWLNAEGEEGRAYLSDAAWAGRYAAINRARIVAAVAEVLGELRIEADPSSHIACDHNHLRREMHEGTALWVHRKGAVHMPPGGLGVIPGSMGSASYHVEGRGNADALASSAHGAGRALSRKEARHRIPAKQFRREVEGVWFDHRLSDDLREEAPSAYKDIGAVMRAQRDLVRVVRRLTPVLVYKAV